ncbi:MAG: polysaccharide biosynthesis protein [Anaerolineae bacterium]|nr:polysaccharide biosynthesis protein [Anaerolineae bacterium]
MRAFDVTSYGIWIEVSTIASLFITFTAYGIFNALGVVAVQEGRSREMVYCNSLYLSMWVSICLAVGMAVGAPLLNSLTTRTSLGVPIMRILSLTVLTSSLNILGTQIYRLRGQPFLGSIFEVSGGFGRLLVVVFALSHHDLIKLAISFVLIQGLITFAQMIVAFRKIPLCFPSWEIIRELVRHAVNLSVVSQAEWVIQYGDRLMLSILSTSVAVAVYAASYQLTLIIFAITGPYLYAILPLLSERWRAGGVPAGQATLRQNMRLMLIVTIPAVVGLGLVGNSLLQVLATTEFAQGGLLVFMVAVGLGLSVLGVNIQYVYHIQGKTASLRSIYICTAIFNVVANLVAIPLFNYYGAGFTTMLTFGLTFYLLWRNTGMPMRAFVDISMVWRCALASILMAVWVWWVVMPDIPHLLAGIIGGAAIYGVSILLLRVVSFAEIRGFVGSLTRQQ